jgi:hypothetical protein
LPKSALNTNVAVMVCSSSLHTWPRLSAVGSLPRRVKEDAKTGIEIWSLSLCDGTSAVGLFNRGRYEIEPPPRPKKGEPTPQTDLETPRPRHRQDGRVRDRSRRPGRIEEIVGNH